MFPSHDRLLRKPGIGALAVEDIVKMLTTDKGSEIISAQEDVPSLIRHGRQKLPLGRYLRRKIREEYGFKETGAQPGWEEKKAQTMRELHLKIEEEIGEMVSLKEAVAKDNLQKIRNIESRAKIVKRRTL